MTIGTATAAAPAAGKLPAPIRRVLFGPVASANVVPAVVRRFRAAIGMGILVDGDRLPREADLAAQLGIAVFSLRDALGRLRDQGLLVTRPGKHGGSFVARAPGSEELERLELISLTSSELRDLSEWRVMLAAQAASLAALRASEVNLTRLEAYAHQVSESATGQEARRAHGHFQMELAAAGQSMRMTRAEFAAHEEVDWLLALAFGSQAQRLASSEGLLALARAVGAHDVAAAKAASTSYTSILLSELAAVRLRLIAADHQSRPASVSTMSQEIVNFASSLLDVLSSLADQVSPLFNRDLDEPELRRSVALAILSRIADLPAHVDEISILAEVGVVPRHSYWTEAWHRTDLGPRRDSSHVMDPARDDFYDYESREFIAEPRRRLTPWATGPYVDYGGADDYIITVSVPVTADGQFLGIAAVDFLVADLERQLSHWLTTADGPCLLLDATGRVIVSNSTAHQVGDIISDRSAFDIADVPVFGWTTALARSA